MSTLQWYVDNLAIALKKPVAILENMTTQHQLKLKGLGPISYHLGADFFRDKEGNYVWLPKSILINW